jgi:hypothetical protein
MKRLITLIFLILVLIPLNNFEIIPKLISYGSFRNHFVEPIDVKFTTLNQKNIKIFRTSSKAKQVELEKYSDDGSRFILRGMSIVFLNDEFNSFENVTVKLGSNIYNYNKAAISNWVKTDFVSDLGPGVAFHFPADFTSTSSMTKLFFWNKNLFQVINWTPNFLFGVCTILILGFFYWVLFRATKYVVLNYQMELKSSPWKKTSIWYALIIAFVFFFVALYFASLGVDVHHQGFVFHAAMRLSEGNILFKEIYYHYGALTALLHCFALKIFGVRLYSLNILTSIFYFFIVLNFINILGRFVKHSFALLFSIVWLAFAPFFVDTFLPWSSVFSLFFLLQSLNFTLLYIDKNKLFYLFLSGISTALCFWARQSVGPLIFAAQIISISAVGYLINREAIYQVIKRNLIFIWGFFIMSLPFFFWIKMENALSDWWLQNMSGQGEWAFGGPIYKLKTIVKIFDILAPFSFWSVLPFVTILILLVLMKKYFAKKSFSTTESQLIVVCIVALASWPQYFPIPCNRHYFWAGTPMFILLAVFLSNIAFPLLMNHSLKKFSTLAVLGLVSIFLSTITFEIINRAILTKDKLATHIFTIQTPEVLRGMKIPSAETVEGLGELDKQIQKYITDYPAGSIVGEEMYNQLFLTLIPKSDLSSPLPSKAFNFGPLKEKYEFVTSQEKFIQERKPLIYSPKPLDLENYHEIFHLKMTKPLEYLSGEVYFYAPILEKVKL